VPEKAKELVQRWGHGAASFTVSSVCVEVILFGGEKKLLGPAVAELVVLRFGRLIMFIRTLLV